MLGEQGGLKEIFSGSFRNQNCWEALSMELCHQIYEARPAALRLGAERLGE